MDEHGEIVRLRERISDLEHEKAAVEGFAAVAAHELLTPVVLMDACAASVRDRLDERDAESLEELDTLRRGAARSRLLAETLLSHAASKDRPLQRRPVDVDALVRDCIALLASEIRRRKAQLVITRPLPLVDADESLIAAVFMNLLVNALKYGPRQGATV